ncbi:MAG: hypothetical protein AAFO03_28345 [Bacteroidota bacterium]
MDFNILTKILTAGAMGASIFCIWKVYDLLGKAQEQDPIDPIKVRTIYAAMVFAVVMTLLSLYIEKVRHDMHMEETNNPQLARQLERIAANAYYSLDKEGIPAAISIPSGDSSLVLSGALPNDFFADHKLIIKELENKYLVQRENKGQLTTTGFLPADQLNGIAGSSADTPPPPAEDLNGENLLNLGLAYTPPSITNQLNIPATRDLALAVNYLIRLLADDFQDQPNLQKKAVRLLTQPRLMQQLQQQQYEALINALESDRIRRAPYNSYELAQVFHSRAYQAWNKENRQQDIDRYRNHLRDYVGYYEANLWIQDADEHPTEKAWYDLAKNELR